MAKAKTEAQALDAVGAPLDLVGDGSASAPIETLAADTVDETLVAAGDDTVTAPTETPAPAEAAAPQLVRVRVLCLCDFGVPNAVVEVDAELAKARTDVLDTDPAAVAYALSQAF